MHLHCYNFSTLLLAYTACLYCSCHSKCRKDQYTTNLPNQEKMSLVTIVTRPTRRLPPRHPRINYGIWYHLKEAHSIAPTEKRTPAAKKPKVQ